MNCPKCGQYIQANWSYCPICGRWLRESPIKAVVKIPIDSSARFQYKEINISKEATDDK